MERGSGPDGDGGAAHQVGGLRFAKVRAEQPVEQRRLAGVGAAHQVHVAAQTPVLFVAHTPQPKRN